MGEHMRHEGSGRGGNETERSLLCFVQGGAGRAVFLHAAVFPGSAPLGRHWGGTDRMTAGEFGAIKGARGLCLATVQQTRVASGLGLGLGWVG